MRLKKVSREREVPLDSDQGQVDGGPILRLHPLSARIQIQISQATLCSQLQTHMIKNVVKVCSRDHVSGIPEVVNTRPSPESTDLVQHQGSDCLLPDVESTAGCWVCTLVSPSCSLSAAGSRILHRLNAYALTPVARLTYARAQRWS